MKSRTSFFNTTVLKKDITRFAPVWGLYSVFVGLFLLLWWEIEASPARFVNTATDILSGMGILNFLYAPLAAFLLFGDLFKSRMCNALHALPLRREGWFLTHFTAGMLFCVVPNGVAALLTAALLQEYFWAAFVWLAVMVLQYLFFFGAATFAIQCSGNLLGGIAVYGIFNFLSTIAAGLAVVFYQPLLYGVKFDTAAITRLSPVVGFTGADYMQTHFNNTTGTTVLEGFVGADWRYLGIAAAVGVVLLVLAVLIYRRRQLESAGDLISLRPVAPVFLVIYTLGVGAVLYLIASSLTPALEYIFLVAGFAIGFFTGRMLLERKVKVFRGKNFLAFGIIVAVFFASLGITALDPVGITRYVPETDNIQYVTICRSHYVYDMNRNTVILTDKEDIETIKNIHKACIDEPFDEESTAGRTPVYIRYEMTNGTTVERYYYIDSESEHADTIQGYFTSVEAVFNGLRPQVVLDNLRMIEVYCYEEDYPLLAIAKNDSYLDISYYTDKYGDSGNCLAYYTLIPGQDDVLIGLFEAIKADCGQGSIAQSGVFHNKELWGHITMKYNMNTYTAYLDIDIYTDSENTIAYLKSLQPAKEPTPEGE